MIIFVDIDNTITVTNGTDYEGAEPVKKCIDVVNDLYEKGHTIVYWTARGTMSDTNYFELTKSQLDSWGCKYHELRMGKPAYDLFIEDKSAVDTAGAQVLVKLHEMKENMEESKQPDVIGPYGYIRKGNRFHWQIKNEIVSNQGFISKADCEKWLEEKRYEYGFEWRVGYMVKFKSQDHPWYLVDKKGKEVKGV